jgi:hypothetical protein
VPSFLTCGRPERGGAWTTHLEETRDHTAAVVHRIFADEEPEPRPGVTLTDFDPEGEDKVLAAICYPQTTLPEDQILARVRKLGTDERASLLAAYVGERTNRRHKPGRAFERTGYRFDVLADYGAFRDLQRHRMLTIEWQALTPAREVLTCRRGERHLRRAGHGGSGRCTARWHFGFPEQARTQWRSATARFVMQMNAREAMHLIELRTTPQGHPAYRHVAQRCTAHRRGSGAPRARRGNELRGPRGVRARTLRPNALRRHAAAQS